MNEPGKRCWVSAGDGGYGCIALRADSYTRCMVLELGAGVWGERASEEAPWRADISIARRECYVVVILAGLTSVCGALIARLNDVMKVCASARCR